MRRACALNAMLSVPGVLSLFVPVWHLPSMTGTGRLVRPVMAAAPSKASQGEHHVWLPQDLTIDAPGFLPIPPDDYVKKYQKNPELWPVELFLIVYRRTRSDATRKSETQLLVRRSANGTSKWGVGTGVPATRWVSSTQEAPPRGYTWTVPPIRFQASNFPEFPRDDQMSWTYDKIDIRDDAFSASDAADLRDSDLEAYASRIQQGLSARLAEQLAGLPKGDVWTTKRTAVVQKVIDSGRGRSAIYGTLRMGGLFASRTEGAPAVGSPLSRYVPLGVDAPDPTELVRSKFPRLCFPHFFASHVCLSFTGAVNAHLHHVSADARPDASAADA